MKNLVIITAISFLTACTNNHSSESKLDHETISKHLQVKGLQAPSCMIRKSRKWHAWIDRYTSNQAVYRLNIFGEVDLPSPGYTLTWSRGITDRMQPPGQRLTLLATPSQGMEIQVITPTETKFTMETPIPKFRHVSIYCGERLLISIPDVVLTD